MTIPISSLLTGTLSQLVAVLIACLVAVSDGMQFGWSAPVLQIFLSPNSPVEITNTQGEWLENCLMLGAFCGLWFTMFIVDKIGRKRCILLASFTSLCVWLILALTPRVEIMFFARTLAGASSNITYIATPMYIAEIAERKIRGFLSTLIFLMMLVGVLLVYCIVPYTPFYIHCILGATIVFIELVIFPFIPESPYFLIYKERPEEAKIALTKLRNKNANIEDELEDIKKAVARQKEETGRPQDLFLVPSNRKAIIIMLTLNTAQHFSSFSVLLMNLHFILKTGGTDYVEPSTAGILFALIMIISTAIASFLIDKLGRRTLLISSSLLTGLCILVLAIYFSMQHSGYDIKHISWIPTVCVMIYAFVFKVGQGTVPIVLTAELFPVKMKVYGMSFADGVYVITSVLSCVLYQNLIDSIGIEYPFYIFSICCFFTTIFTFFYIPETKGKSLEEIQMILKGR